MHTLSQLIERFIKDMDDANMKPLGETHKYALQAIMRRPIGQKIALNLKRGDWIEYAKERRRTVSPATVNQDVTYIGGVLKYAGSAWSDCEDITAASIDAARPFLVKHNLVGKSVPRKRRPSGDEETRLLNYFLEQDKGCDIKMAEVMAFALVSTRRLGEICRITWGDIDWEHKDNAGNPAPMYWVRDLKHPTKKKGNDKAFPLFEELAVIIRRQPRLRPDNPTERVFPFNSKSCSHRYTLAKHELGIEDLHFHDNRREAISRWLKILPPHRVRHISGHETTLILERVYDGTNPDVLHQEVREKAAA